MMFANGSRKLIYLNKICKFLIPFLFFNARYYSRYLLITESNCPVCSIMMGYLQNECQSVCFKWIFMSQSSTLKFLDSGDLFFYRANGARARAPN